MYYHNPVTVQKKDIVKLLQKTPALHILLKMDHRPKKTTPETPLGTPLQSRSLMTTSSTRPAISHTGQCTFAVSSEWRAIVTNLIYIGIASTYRCCVYAISPKFHNKVRVLKCPGHLSSWIPSACENTFSAASNRDSFH